jgi:hypothetical protein
VESWTAAEPYRKSFLTAFWNLEVASAGLDLRSGLRAQISDVVGVVVLVERRDCAAPTERALALGPSQSIQSTLPRYHLLTIFPTVLPHSNIHNFRSKKTIRRSRLLVTRFTPDPNQGHTTSSTAVMQHRAQPQYRGVTF